MRNSYKLLALLAAYFIINLQANAACTGGTSAGRITTSENWQLLNVNGGTYYEFNAAPNYIYSFSFCQSHGGANGYFDAEITILNKSGNPVNGELYTGICATTHIQPYINWTCKQPGTYRVLVTRQNCIAQPNLGVLAYRSLPANECPSGLGDGLTNVQALPYSSGPGNLMNAGNDQETNIQSCGNDEYYGGTDKAWRIKTPVSGIITAALQCTSPGVSLSVFEGCPLQGNAGRCLGVSQGDGSRTLSFCAKADKEYYLLVDSKKSSSGFSYTNLTISAAVETHADLPGKISVINTLPWKSGQRSTCGKNNDITAANIAANNNSRYTEGEDEIFVFTANETGDITVTTSASTPYSGFFLFDGSPMSAGCDNSTGNLVADACYSSAVKNICAHVTKGHSYYLIADSWSGCYNYTMAVSAPSVKSEGADCFNPVVIQSLPFVMMNETTACMGDDYNNYGIGSCGSMYESGEDKVYTYTSRGPECIGLSLTEASSASIGYHVYAGIPGTPGSICLTSGGHAERGSLNAAITLPSAGTYFIIIDSWADPSTVNYNMLLVPYGTGAANDQPCNAIPIKKNDLVKGDNTCSSSNGEPVPQSWLNNNCKANTVWFSYKPQSSSPFRIRTTSGSLLHTQLAVYTGNCNGALILKGSSTAGLQCSATASMQTSCASYTVSDADASVMYYIAVDGAENEIGSFGILIEDIADPQTVYYGQDCTSPLPVCQKEIKIADPGFYGCGDRCDYAGGGTSCLNDGEINTSWYELKMADNGFLEFTVIPNDWQGAPGIECSDYDFALYKTSGSGAVTVQQINNGVQPLRCSFSRLGITGLYSTSGSNAPAEYPGLGISFKSGINVANGDKFLLAVSNYSGSTSGYTLKFGNAVPLVNNQLTTAVWTGAVSSDWNDADNWLGCGIPDAASDVIIPSFPSDQPSCRTSISVHNITIMPGSSLTLADSSVFSVSGDVINKGRFESNRSTLQFNGNTDQHLSGNLTSHNLPANILVNKPAGQVIIDNDILVDGDIIIGNNNRLNAGNTKISLQGSLVNDGKFICNQCALEFTGNSLQRYQNTDSLYTAVINNKGHILLTTDMIISRNGSLNMKRGKIITDDNKVIVTATSSASLTGGNAGSYVAGNLCRYMSNSISPCSYDWLVGSVNKGFERFSMAFANGLTNSPEWITVRFNEYQNNIAPVAGADSSCNKNYNVAALDNGYWSLSSSSAASITAEITLYNQGFKKSAGAYTVMQQTDGNSWFIPTDPSNTCQATPVQSVSRKNVAIHFNAGTAINFATAQASIVIPVNWLSLEAEANHDRINIHWNTASEENTRAFILQRSTRPGEWIPVGWLDGNGSTVSLQSYQLADKRVAANVLYYYRIRHVDENGEEYFSRTVAAQIRESAVVSAQAFPNPFRDNFKVKYLLGKGATVSIQLTDAAGRIVQTIRPGKQEAGQYTATFSDLASASGIYTVIIWCDDDKYQVRVSHAD